MTNAVANSSSDGTHEITLILDDDDYQHIVAAMRCRDEIGVMPDGEGNAEGRLLAEIARGWGGFTGFLDEINQECRDTISGRWAVPPDATRLSGERLLSDEDYVDVPKPGGCG